MPRPKRSRPGAVATDKKAAQPDVEPAPRGRARTTRSMASRTSADVDSILDAANRTRDTALDRLANEDITTTGDDDTAGSVELGRRSSAATPAQRRDITGLDLVDDVFGDLEDSFEDEGSVRGRSTEVSSFTLSHIKPRSRSRQSSIVGRNDPPIRPSSRGGTTPLVSSTFNISAFRRRAREPSILGTGRKPRPDVTSTTFTTQGDNRSDTEDEEEEDFAPEAESTPLNNRRRTRPAPQEPESEREQELDPEPVATRSSKKRKSDGPAETARPEKVSRTDDPEPEEDADSDSSSLSSLPSFDQPLPELGRPVTPVNQMDYAAPPASSGSEDEDFEWPDIHGLAKRRRRPSAADPLDHDSMSNVSSPPSLTHSPNFETKAAKTRGRARRQSSPKLTTADLANLLPKRRHQRAHSPVDLPSDDEIDTAGIGHDEDELSYVDAPRRRKATRSATRGGSTRQTTRGGPSTSKQPEKKTGKSRPSLTYSRRSSDKENESEGDGTEGDEQSRFQPLPDDTFEADSTHTPEGNKTEELKQAAAKFKEVDRWELEYEEATQSSSPAGAR
ncbi:unnamed protein product [Clonostachys chloroleuca]|uniref:Uncharacterized protein n=1 Tax=Clonostachys chloroleuca TaxID=1926264 RepID=A0AA35M1F2_9HYPO|nr:unnamed protein product [Clonostachys chloroleuca]